jgi:hypothetical protein
MTQWRILKNSGFSFRDSGVGGSVVDVPIARDCVGGVFGRKERMYDFVVAEGFSCMYCGSLLAAIVWRPVVSLASLTMCLLLGIVEIARL